MRMPYDYLSRRHPDLLRNIWKVQTFRRDWKDQIVREIVNRLPPIFLFWAGIRILSRVCENRTLESVNGHDILKDLPR